MTELYDAALESLGIYPAARRIEGDAEWRYRTDWENGWNDAIIALLQNHKALFTWIKSLREYEADALLYLLQHDAIVLTLSRTEDKVNMFVPMNDVFGYAEADAEPFKSVDTLTQLQVLHRKFGWDGLIAWAAFKRNEHPIPERCTQTYRDALRWMD